MSEPLPDHLRAGLIQRLGQPLPGRASQRSFSPELAYGRHFGPPLWNARPAAVLVLLYPQAGGWWLPLTLRPVHMVEHAGQISLPGGAIDSGETAEACALRECQEELGVDPDCVQLVGRLTPLYIFNSNFLVTPCVGLVSERPAFTPNPAEVARLLEVEMATLIDPTCRIRQVVQRRGICFQADHLQWEADYIWGATGMILAEFLAVFQDVLT